MPKQPNLLSIQVLRDSAECLKIIAHPLRLRIVDILMQGEYPVHEIARLCETPPSQACAHLSMMKRNNLLGSKRRGKTVYYHISSNVLTAVIKCIMKHHN